MSTVNTPTRKAQQPDAAGPSQQHGKPGAEQTYNLICLAALLVLLLTVVQRSKLDYIAILPVLIGVIGLVTHWISVPPVFVFVLAWVLMAPRLFHGGQPHRVHGEQWVLTASFPRFQVADLILCAAAFTFLAAYYRLIALSRHIFPADPKSKQGFHGPGRWLASNPSLAGGNWRRSTSAVAPDELLYFFLSVLGWTALARVGQMALGAAKNPLGLEPSIWQALLLVWFLGSCLLIARTWIGYLRLSRLTTEQARMLLEDELWHNTRGEQRFLLRWTAWLTLKRHQKER
jgi:hypothetical protein